MDTGKTQSGDPDKKTFHLEEEECDIGVELKKLQFLRDIEVRLQRLFLYSQMLTSGRLYLGTVKWKGLEMPSM